MRYRVFLSHCSKDIHLVEALPAYAKSHNIDIYLYEHDPQLGMMIADKIQRRIEQSDAFVVILTKSSEDSVYVQQEIGAALNAKKPVVPLVGVGFDTSKLGMLEGTKYIPFAEDDPESALSKLVRYLANLKKGKERGLMNALLFVAGTLLLGAMFGGDQDNDIA